MTTNFNGARLRSFFELSKSLNYYMPNTNELRELDSHFGEIRRQPFLGSVLLFPTVKKNINNIK